MIMRENDEGSAARILSAASDLLAEEGYEALSMRKVAAKVGLSQAAIYRHYADKAELVAMIVEAGYSRLRSMVEGLDEEIADPEELIAEGIRAYVGFARESPRLFKAVLFQDIGPARGAVDAFSPGVARKRRTFELLSARLARGMASGAFSPADPEVTAQALWATMFGLAARFSIEADRGREDSSPSSAEAKAESERRMGEVMEREIEIVMRGLRAS